jgi:hypothetical protein
MNMWEEVEMQEDIGCGDKVSDHGGAQLTPRSEKHDPLYDVAMEEDICYIHRFTTYYLREAVLVRFGSI